MSEEKRRHARRHVSPCVRRRHPAKQRVKRHRDDMTTSSREKKRRAQAGEETGERKTQGRKREAGSLPGSKTAQKAQKGAWETQLFYVIDYYYYSSFRNVWSCLLDLI